MPETVLPEVIDEQIYEDLQAYADAGMIDYVLPTEPLGEEWIVGWRGKILKFTTKDQIVGFLTGIQVGALFAADLKGPANLREWFRERPQVHGAAVRSVRTEWAAAYGGEDANDCAGVLTYDDEAEAREHAQWIKNGFVSRCTVITTRWERVEGDD